MSVIIPAYNAEAYIERSLKTALAQTFASLEIIVVNDGSHDRTADVVREVARENPCILLIEQENLGMAEARNRGLAAARGDLIAFLDQDDLWHREKIQRQVAYLDQNPGVAVVTCYSAILDNAGRCLGWRFGGHANGHVYGQMLKQDLVAGGSVPLIRRQALQATGFFDKEISVRSDWDMWLRLARDFAFGTVPQDLVGYTRRPDSASHDYEDMIQTGAALLLKVSREDSGFTNSMRRFCHARDTFAMASLCFIDEDFRLAWKFLRRSMSISLRPVLCSFRRLGVVMLLVLSTLLPDFIYRRLFSIVARLVFRAKPGQPFQE